MQTLKPRRVIAAAALSALTLVAACGGSSPLDNGPGNPEPAFPDPVGPSEAIDRAQDAADSVDQRSQDIANQLDDRLADLGG